MLTLEDLQKQLELDKQIPDEDEDEDEENEEVEEEEDETLGGVVAGWSPASALVWRR